MRIYTQARSVFLARFLLLTVFIALAGLAVNFTPRLYAVDYPLTVADDTGTQVTLRAKPVRIVSLTLMSDEILLGLVEPARFAAISNLAADPAVSNIVAQARQVKNQLAFTVEGVIALRPDLVIVANWSDPAKVDQVRKAGLSVYLVQTPLTLAAIKQQIIRLGRLVDEETKAARLIADMDTRLAAVQTKLARRTGKALSAMDYNTWGSASGIGSSFDELLRLSGVVNAVSSLQSDEWGQVGISKELLISLSPEVLILPGWVYGDAAGAAAFEQQIRGDASLRAVRALQANRLFQMPEYLKSSTSQYFVAAVEWLAARAYPELFK